MENQTSKCNIDLLKLYTELSKLLPNGNIQDVMNVAYQITNVPILAVDLAYNVLGAAPSQKMGDPMWDLLLEQGGYDIDQGASLYEDGVIQCIDIYEAPFLVDWGENKEHPKIQGVIKINQIVEGYVTMNCNYQEITPSRIKAMDIIMHICSFMYKKMGSHNSISYSQQTLFSYDLFHNKIKTEDQLKRWFRTINYTFDGPYQLVTIKPQKSGEENVISYIRKYLQQNTSHLLLNQEKNTLEMLYYNTDMPQFETHIAVLQEIAEKFHVRIGISNSFDHMIDIPIYQQQAEDALTYGEKYHPNDVLHLFRDYALPAILLPRIAEMPKSNYIPEVLFEIKAYDQKHHTDFYETIHCYILHLKNTKDTADALSLHRNTLIYRINKIEELFALSFNDFQNVLHLMLIFYLQDLFPQE